MRVYVAAVLFVALSFPCAGNRGEADSGMGVFSRLNTLANSGRHREFISLAMPLYRQAVQENDLRASLLLGAGIAEMYVKIDEGDSARKYLDTLLPLAEEAGYTSVLMKLYNICGMYALYYRLDYAEAAGYFLKATAYVRDTLNDGNYRIIANNLAHTYNLKQDTAGLKYSLQTYRAGKKLGDDHLVFLGSVNTATQYCLRKDWDNAFSYISEALGLVDRFYGKVEVYSVYADVLSALGENAGAEKYYTMALALADSAETVTVCGLCRSYGRFLIKKEGRPSEAADIFSKGIALALKAKSYMYRYELYLGLSEALDLTGDTRGALDNFRIYHYLCDSVFNTEKERSMNEMLVKYETEKTARLLQEKSRRLDAAVYVIILMAVIISAVVILSMRRRYICISNWWPGIMMLMRKKGKGKWRGMPATRADGRIPSRSA